MFRPGRPDAEKLINEKFSAAMLHLFFSFPDQDISGLDFSPVSPCMPFYTHLFPVCH
jgi:hypothetical protein